jgi:error-prone DNA polymerase
LIKREQNLKLHYHPGARLVFADGTPDILSYPRDRAGWGRLCRLLTCGNLRAAKGDCILYLDDLLAHADGLELIVMPECTRDREPEFLHKSRAAFGDGARAPKQAENPDILSILREAAPGRVRLAARMLHRGRDRAYLAARAEEARKAGVPLIAVNDVLYHAPERRELQDILTCVRNRVKIDTAGRILAANAERHLKPPEEMARLFRDFPQAIEETARLDAVLGFSLDELKYEYPDETREGFASTQEALAHLAWEGASKRYPGGVPKKIRNALDHELKLIAELEYAPYFLTVHDIVRFARGEGILCRGRGSHPGHPGWVRNQLDVGCRLQPQGAGAPGPDQARP